MVFHVDGWNGGEAPSNGITDKECRYGYRGKVAIHSGVCNISSALIPSISPKDRHSRRGADIMARNSKSDTWPLVDSIQREESNGNITVGACIGTPINVEYLTKHPCKTRCVNARKLENMAQMTL
jgi:hypothetical protein